MTDIPLTGAPAEMLRRLGKDPRLAYYGGGNFGTPRDLLDLDGSLIVPTARFFIRSNGPIPLIEPESYRLTVGGAVERPLSLALADLEGMPQRELTGFLECAGNSRTRFEPRPEGTPWRDDAVGAAVWEGVSLAHLLDLAGARPEGVDLVAQGGDMPSMQRGLPLAVAREPDVLVALRMNGAPLLPAHGFPARLFVPGWAGIASTKWLTRLTLLDRPFAGFWNADNYVFWSEAGEPLRPVREMPPKAVLHAPRDGESIAAGDIAIVGYAWSGYGAIRTVEVSVDGGETWSEAALESGGRFGWTRFRYEWQAAPGEHLIAARATDERGLRQPWRPAWNAKGYQYNGIQTVRVTAQG
ncbi:MAG TPA: sulfite oxidase [Thermomicrobiales bacterium]|jgi:DMSO/TMAO reductase YedYZ molybdopterin-dependent catalytic subunit|nr:sulfite oxidase [Thermomicrobiales bacterium]